MKILSLIAAGLVFSQAVASAQAADDVSIQRLALCQDSWLDWKNSSDPAPLQKFIEHFRASFTPHGNDPYSLPKGATSIIGLHVTQVFPESIGMAVGFSLTVAAPFDIARKAVEQQLGKKLKDCETGDDMRTCGLEIAKERTVTLMAEDNPKAKETLIGCYYLYEK